MKSWIVLFLLLLVAGAMFGLGRDLYSHEVRVVKGTVVAYDPAVRDLKSGVILATPMYRIKLENGEEIDAATTDAKALAAGSAVNVVEMSAPWGHLWYKKSGS